MPTSLQEERARLLTGFGRSAWRGRELCSLDAGGDSHDVPRESKAAQRDPEAEGEREPNEHPQPERAVDGPDVLDGERIVASLVRHGGLHGGAFRACKPLTVGKPEKRYTAWTFAALGPLSPGSAS